MPQHPHAALLLVHGLCEHSGRYEATGAWLARRGVAVHAYDAMGHGHSTGRRGHVERFDHYLDDLDQIFEDVRADQPRLPLFLMGHSMGGLVAATYARERKPALAGLVLSAPAFGLPRRHRRQRWLARCLRRLWPGLRAPSGIPPEALSRDPAVAADYLADPLVEQRLSVSLADELFAQVPVTAAGGADVTPPLLVLHGGDDRLCPPEASRRFAEAAPAGRWVRYPGLRHEILQEPERETVLKDLYAWLEEVRTSAPPAAGSGT